MTRYYCKYCKRASPVFTKEFHMTPDGVVCDKCMQKIKAGISPITRKRFYIPVRKKKK